MSLEEKVKAVFKDVLEIESDEIKPDETLDQSLGMDSTEMVELAVAIKKEFKAHRLVFITSNHLDLQLRQVITEIGICPADTRPFSRCIHCNVPIVDADPEDVCGLIPDYICETHIEFRKCLQCNRIFWPGSHTRRSLERIEHLFDVI